MERSERFKGTEAFSNEGADRPNKLDWKVSRVLIEGLSSEEQSEIESRRKELDSLWKGDSKSWGEIREFVEERREISNIPQNKIDDLEEYLGGEVSPEERFESFATTENMEDVRMFELLAASILTQAKMQGGWDNLDSDQKGAARAGEMISLMALGKRFELMSEEGDLSRRDQVRQKKFLRASEAHLQSDDIPQSFKDYLRPIVKKSKENIGIDSSDKTQIDVPEQRPRMGKLEEGVRQKSQRRDEVVTPDYKSERARSYEEEADVAAKRSRRESGVVDHLKNIRQAIYDRKEAMPDNVQYSRGHLRELWDKGLSGPQQNFLIRDIEKRQLGSAMSSRQHEEWRGYLGSLHKERDKLSRVKAHVFGDEIGWWRRKFSPAVKRYMNNRLRDMRAQTATAIYNGYLSQAKKGDKKAAAMLWFARELDEHTSEDVTEQLSNANKLLEEKRGLSRELGGKAKRMEEEHAATNKQESESSEVGEDAPEIGEVSDHVEVKKEPAEPAEGVRAYPVGTKFVQKTGNTIEIMKTNYGKRGDEYVARVRLLDSNGAQVKDPWFVSLDQLRKLKKAAKIVGIPSGSANEKVFEEV